MRIKSAAQLAVVGVILRILPVIMVFFIPFSKTLLISSFMRMIGNILLVIFFYVFIVRQQNTSTLRTAGVLGLIGYLIIVILNVTGIIFNSVFYISVKDPLKYMDLMNIASILSRVNFVIGLIPILLIIACFMAFYRNLIEKSSFKKVALLALIGQFISLTVWIIGFIFNILLFRMLYQIVSTRGLTVIITVESVIEIIALVLLATFFISLNKLLSNNEDMQQMAYM